MDFAALLPAVSSGVSTFAAMLLVDLDLFNKTPSKEAKYNFAVASKRATIGFVTGFLTRLLGLPCTVAETVAAAGYAIVLDLVSWKKSGQRFEWGLFLQRTTTAIVAAYATPKIVPCD